MKYVKTVRAWPAWVWALVAAVFFAGLVSLKGVPVLRHDWSWDADPNSFFPNLWSSFGGWQSFGIGLARPYPDDYLLVVVNAVFIGLFGSTIIFPVEMAAIGFACSFGASRLAERITPVRGVALAASTFAIFNPWVYNKVVAGHIFMVLAYGATMLAISEMLQNDPSPRRLTVFVLLTMQQLQFFFPLIIAVTIWTLIRRGSLLPIGVAFVTALPVLVGIVADRRYLVTIPYTATWQSNASLTPGDALILSGYFAKYADALPGFVRIAGWCVVAIALAGVVIAFRRYPRPTAAAVVLFAGIWIFSSGDKGLLGSAYTWLVLHVPESALYRELYDLVGFLAIGLIVASAYSARIRFVPAIWAICGLAYALAWCIAPPSQYWAGYNQVPRPIIVAQTNSRFALFPALQPLGLAHVGSGLDPDAVVRANNVDPLNTPQLSFPETPSLMAYARTGDERWLTGLSVSQFIVRPYLHTRYDILGAQLAIPVSERAVLVPGTHVIANYEPELGLHALPQLSALPARPWETSIFFGDARDVRGPSVPRTWNDVPALNVVHPSNGAVSAADGWVDVRSAFAAEPLLAQGIGGVVTTNPNAVIALDPRKWTLVAVNGRLLNERGRVIDRGGGYRWIRPGNSAAHCTGTCVVVAQTTQPRSTNAGIKERTIAVGFDQWSPWLAFATIPPGDSALLRYNVRYDEHWLGLLDSAELAHVAIDSTFNGWVVPARDRSQRLIIIEWIAAVQFALMVIGLSTVVVLGVYWSAVARKVARSEAILL